MPKRKYDAFMSYSHRSDRELARTFQSDLERFGGKFPWTRTRRVFRDETNLAANPQLWAELERAIDASDRMILLASPLSAESAWIPRELDRFTKRRGAGELAIVLTLGKTRYTDGHGLAEDENALAPSTVALLDETDEPFIVDLRPFRDSPRRARWSREYMLKLASVAAFVSDCEKDELFSEHITRQRRWLAALVMISLLVLALAGIATQQASAARAAERTARQEQMVSEQLRGISDVQLRAARAQLMVRERADSALALAAQAWEAHPDEVAFSKSTDTVRQLAKQARHRLIAALAEVLSAHPGLLGHLHAHSGTVETLQVGQDAHLLSAAMDGRAILWDLDSQAALTELGGAEDRRLVRAARAADTVVIASATGVMVSQGSSSQIHDMDLVSAIAIRARGDLIAIGRGNGAVLLLEVQTGEPVRLAKRDGLISALAFSHDGSRLYVGAYSQANRVEVWDMVNRRRVAELRGHSLAATSLATNSDGQIAASTEGDEVVLWDSNGELVARWLAETTVTAVTFDSNRPGRVYAAQADGALVTWETERSTPLHVRYANRGGAFSVTFDRASDRVITGGADGVIRLWEPDPAHPLVRRLPNSDGHAGLGRFDGNDVIAIDNGIIRRWAHPYREYTDTMIHAPTDLGAVALDQHSRVILAPPYEADQHDLWIAHPEPAGSAQTLPNPSRYLHPVTLDANSLVAVAPGHDGGLWRWALDTGERTELAPSADAIAFDRSGKRFFAALANQELTQWRVPTWRKSLRTKLTTSEKATSLALSDDGALLAIGRMGGDVEIRRAADPTIVTHRVSEHRDVVAALAFRPDSTWLAASDRFGLVALVDASTGNVLARFPPQPDAFVRSIEFDASGTQLLVSRGDSLVVISVDPNEWAAHAIRIAGSQAYTAQ